VSKVLLSRGRGNIVASVLLFLFLVVMITMSILIFLSDRRPEVVQVDLTKISEQAGDIPAPPTVHTELLRPEPDVKDNTIPIAQFRVNSPVYVGERVDYEDLSYDRDIGGEIVNRRWGGRVSFFTKPGSHTISLRVQDDQGAWSEMATRVIHVMERPRAEFNFPPIALFRATNPVFVGERLFYEDASYDPDGDAIVDRKWEGQRAVFTTAGRHRVTLTVKDSRGKWSDPIFQYIEVRERPAVDTQRPPIAIFSVTSPVFVGQRITYTDKSFDQDPQDSIVTREWSANKQDSYDRPGRHDITLRVRDSRGNWSESFTQTVVVLESSNLPPVADFSVNPNPARANQRVELRNTSFDPDGVISREVWGGDVRYLYSAPGQYSVTLTVWDDRGASATITKMITVLPAHNEAPVSRFRTNSPVMAGEKVYFWDDSFDGDGEIVSRTWAGNKQDIYEVPGTYQVTLSVRDNLGVEHSSTQSIVVLPRTNRPPVAQISGPSEVFVNETAVFRDASTDPDGHIVSNSWGAASLTRTWSRPGVYYVDIQVTDNRGARSTVQVAILVRARD